MGVQSIVFIDPDPDTPGIADLADLTGQTDSGDETGRIVRPVTAVQPQARSEILVPADASDEQVSGLMDGQLVTGPPVVLSEALDAIQLTRDAAGLLRHGVVVDPRPVVPYEDLLGPLLLSRDRLLTGLLVTKHLEPLQELTPRRRLILGELLLTMLERGGPMNQLARDRGTSPQTDYSRLVVLREIFGHKLDNPDQRFELIVALRTALPDWRATADTKRPRRR